MCGVKTVHTNLCFFFLFFFFFLHYSWCRSFFVCFWSPCSTQYNVRGLKTVYSVIVVFMTSFLTGGTLLMSFLKFKKKFGFLHNLTNKMNVGVWALTFGSEKEACVLFVSICFYFHFPKKREEEEKDVVLALCCVLKVKTKKINQSGFLYFHSFFVWCLFNVHSAG